MNKGLAYFLAVLAFCVSYIPAVVFYFKPDLTFGLSRVFNIPLYMALAVSAFLIMALIAFYVRAYSVGVVIAFIPVIIYVTIGIIAGIAFLFYRDIVMALIKEHVEEMVAAPLGMFGEGVKKIGETAGNVIKSPFKLFGK